MTETKHTPGPWEADNAPDSSWRVLDGDGYVIVQSVWASTAARHSGTLPERIRANAYLMAAAPKMYAALDSIFRRALVSDALESVCRKRATKAELRRDIDAIKELAAAAVDEARPRDREASR